MEDQEDLIIKLKDGKLRLVINRQKGWNEYKRMIPNRDFNLLAIAFYELNRKGYPIEKAFAKFKDMIANPDLFFV